MAGKIEQLTGVTVNTGVKLYRDASINKGTRALFDVSSAWAGGAADVAAGGQIKSLTFEDSVASLVQPHAYQGGGLVWPGVGASRFMLPENAAPQPDDRHWLFTLWVKINSPGGNSFNNQLMSIAGGAVNTTSYQMLSVIPTASAGAMTQVEVRIRAKNYVVSTPLASLYDGEVHQAGFELEISEDGTQQRVFMYLDAALVYTSGWAAVATAPVAPDNRFIGTSPSFPMSWKGAFYRTRLDDLTLSGVTAAEILADDYASSRSRFS